MPVGAEGLRDGPIGRKEPLRLAQRFESLHPPLPLTRRLVGVFRAIIEIAMLALSRRQ